MPLFCRFRPRVICGRRLPDATTWQARKNFFRPKGLVSAKGRLRMELGRCHKAGRQKTDFGQGSFADGGCRRQKVHGPAKKIHFSQGSFENGTGLMPQGGPAKKPVSANGPLRWNWVDATRAPAKKSVSAKGRLRMERLMDPRKQNDRDAGPNRRQTAGQEKNRFRPRIV